MPTIDDGYPVYWTRLSSVQNFAHQFLLPLSLPDIASILSLMRRLLLSLQCSACDEDKFSFLFSVSLPPLSLCRLNSSNLSCKTESFAAMWTIVVLDVQRWTSWVRIRHVPLFWWRYDVIAAFDAFHSSCFLFTSLQPRFFSSSTNSLQFS